MIKNLLLVGLGGGIGSMMRYLIQKWVLPVSKSSGFPFGTLIVNITGCLLIGILFGLSLKNSYSEPKQVFLLTGLCGGFTTFSAFTLEGNELIREDRFGIFLLYIAGSVVVGLLATWLGFKLIR